jgi:FlaA1/EpsC-like NDP-sugar epimerase
MSIEEAVRLVIDSGILCRGGEVFVTKMPAIRIQDLAEVMVEELAPACGHRAQNIKIQVVGHQPGEKLYEELLNMEETRRSWELARYFVILPAFREIYRDIEFDYPDITSKEVTSAYHSGTQKPLSKIQLATFLKENNLLHPD